MSSTHVAPPPDAARRDLVDRFLALQPHLRHRFTPALPDELRDVIGPVTFHQMEALRTVARRGSITMGELADCLDAASMSTATQMADRLVRLGLVDRSGDPDDRRLVRIALSAKGRSLHDEMEAGWRRGTGEALACLSDEECATLVHLLERVAGTPPEEEATRCRPACLS
jgi:DNA-binding MarR family transcriptional regulator